MNIKKVKKNDEHCKIIMDWRNDEITRKMSFNNELKEWDSFKKIFYDKYFDNYIKPIFCYLNNEPICFIGFIDLEEKFSVDIGINMNPDFRGKKLGKKILEKTLIYLENNYPLVQKILAEIKVENIPSRKIFEQVGFKFIEKKYIKDSLCNLYEFSFIKNQNFKINNRIIGLNYPTYIIAEMSCNHNQDIKVAYKLIDEAKKAGADAIKLQTYTPDTMTIKSDKPIFKECLKGTLWENNTLYDLYSKAYTPWEWHKDLKKYANKLGLDLFSSPFDPTAVDFLESINVPAYKIASFEITDHILIKKVAQTGKPVIISSGMASLSDLNDAIKVLKDNGCTQICMLKCTSAYPADPKDANLITIKHMAETFNIITGLSDHTLGVEVPIAAVALGARVIEKHFTLSRESGSADDAFSLTPDEFKQMVDSVRIVEKTIGKITYGTHSENKSKKFRRSLFVVEDIKKGDLLTEENIRSIRPSNGLHTKFYYDILGKKARQDLEKGTPLNWDLFE